MPYTKQNLPAEVKKLPAKAQDIFIAAYNNAHENYDGDPEEKEATCQAVARAAVKKQGYTFSDHKQYEVLLEDGKLEKLTKNLFKKQLVRFGAWVDPHNPSRKMILDKKFAENLISNFKQKVINRIPVPLTHTDAPEFNTGELVDLSVEEDGLYGTLEIRDEETADKIRRDLIWDVSIGFDEDYIDKRSGKQVGPALLHVALVNNPYLKGMNPFEAVKAALANKVSPGAIMLAEDANQPEGDQMGQIKNDRDFPVKVKVTQDGEEKEVELQPGDELEVSDDQVEGVEKQIADAEAPKSDEGGEGEGEGSGEGSEGEGKEGEGSEGGEGEAGAGEGAGSEGGEEGEEDKDKELSETKKQLADAQKKLAEKDAEQKFADLLEAGKVLPAHKDKFMELCRAAGSQTVMLSDGKTEANVAELVADLFENGPKLVKFGEDGKDEGAGEDRPSSELSDGQKEGLKALGLNEEDYDETMSDKGKE